MAEAERGGTGKGGREEDFGRRRQKKSWREEDERGGEEEAAAARDPLMVFGSDIMMKIMEFLGARGVASSILVSQGWHDLATSDHLWAPMCEELWKGKAHLPLMSNMRGTSKLAAYSLAIMDGKRTRIVKEDLCDHIWEFRFKETAPVYWLNLDPSWEGTGPPMHRYFHPDGSQTADATDRVWGGHECTYLTTTSFVDHGQIRDHYVRINRWPQMAVSRREDWSWEMSNHFYCYNSVPDAEKKGGTGPCFPVW